METKKGELHLSTKKKKKKEVLLEILCPNYNEDSLENSAIVKEDA